MMASLTLVGCKKEDDVILPPTTTSISGQWMLTESVSGQLPTTRDVILKSDGTLTGGVWSLSGNTFTMTRYSSSYTGNVAGTKIDGSMTPTGTFTMSKR